MLETTNMNVTAVDREATVQKYKKGTCKRVLKRLDIYIMKPLFVYKYDLGLARKRDEFFEKFKKEGWEMEA